jgi:hypothetical protein
MERKTPYLMDKTLVRLLVLLRIAQMSKDAKRAMELERLISAATLEVRQLPRARKE